MESSTRQRGDSPSLPRVGDRLPGRDVELTVTLIVAGAIASRDFYPGHHDKDVANRLGMRHVFMNIHTTNGLVTAYVTDWADPQAVVERVALRLGAPNYPGDTMRLSGRVEERDAERLSVRVEALNGLGRHCDGLVTLRLGPGGR